MRPGCAAANEANRRGAAGGGAPPRDSGSEAHRPIPRASSECRQEAERATSRARRDLVLAAAFLCRMRRPTIRSRRASARGSCFWPASRSPARTVARSCLSAVRRRLRWCRFRRRRSRFWRTRFLADFVWAMGSGVRFGKVLLLASTPGVCDGATRICNSTMRAATVARRFSGSPDPNSVGARTGTNDFVEHFGDLGLRGSDLPATGMRTVGTGRRPASNAVRTIRPTGPTTFSCEVESNGRPGRAASGSGRTIRAPGRVRRAREGVRQWRRPSGSRAVAPRFSDSANPDPRPMEARPPGVRDERARRWPSATPRPSPAGDLAAAPGEGASRLPPRLRVVARVMASW